jgi:hypothetical protein
VKSMRSECATSIRADWPARKMTAKHADDVTQPGWRLVMLERVLIASRQSINNHEIIWPAIIQSSSNVTPLCMNCRTFQTRIKHSRFEVELLTVSERYAVLDKGFVNRIPSIQHNRISVHTAQFQTQLNA